MNLYLNESMNYNWSVYKHCLFFVDNLRKSKVAIAEEDLASQAELVLTVPGFTIEVQGTVGEYDEYIRYVNQQNTITELKECKYLNLIIPGTEKQRIDETKWDRHKRYYTEEMDVKKCAKANEKFMNQLRNKQDCGDLEEETKVVKTKQDLEEAVTDFVLENKSSYRKLFITLNCHGGYEKETNYGTIITHGKVYRTDDYIELLKEVSHAHNILIETLMGQCHSHLYDENIVSLKGKVTVYATTTAEIPKSIISIAPRVEPGIMVVQTASCSEEYEINIVNDILYAEHLGFRKHVSDLPQPNPNLVPDPAVGKGQDPGSLFAGVGVDIQPGIGGRDSQDMDTN